MSTERWKPIPGYEGKYEASDLGRVRSLTRMIVKPSRTGRLHHHTINGRVLRPGRCTSGHMSVVLGRGNGSYHVHTLVLAAFVGPRPVGKEGRHKNGVPGDNQLTNLEYATRGRNNQDKKWHNGASTYRLSPEQVADIKRRLGPHGMGAVLAEEYGVAETTISAIKTERFHTDVRP